MATQFVFLCLSHNFPKKNFNKKGELKTVNVIIATLNRHIFSIWSNIPLIDNRNGIKMFKILQCRLRFHIQFEHKCFDTISKVSKNIDHGNLLLTS